MKALVIGYGSIGERHARLLGQLGMSVAVVSRRPVEAPNLYPSIEAAMTGFAPDYVVIASRTSEHRDDLGALKDTGFDGILMMEKPVFDNGDGGAEGLAGPAYAGFNMRFHPVLRRFRELVAETTPFAVQAYVGQYLPDWRKGADYRERYSAIKALGGGVLRDCCHELDYLNWIFGGWGRLTAIGGHFSNLEIDSDDVFSLLIETVRCPAVSLHMNYLDDTLHRHVLALTDKGSIRADIAAGTVTHAGGTEHFTLERDDTYIAQHEAALRGDTSILCTLEEGLDVMRMIDAAETSAACGAWVSTTAHSHPQRGTAS